eukprot:637156-Amorphochlora_amoeboformis.AAC.1
MNSGSGVLLEHTRIFGKVVERDMAWRHSLILPGTTRQPGSTGKVISEQSSGSLAILGIPITTLRTV